MNRHIMRAIFFPFFYYALSGAGCLAQEGEIKSSSKTNALTADEMKKVVMEAVKVVDAEKEMKQKKLEESIASELDLAVKRWIGTAASERQRQLNTFVEQQWQYLTRLGPRFHHDYMLRDFLYDVVTAEVIKSGSLNIPYKGYVEMTEDLFVEKKHLPDASDPTKYYYTVTTLFKIYFEYRGNQFIVANTDSSQVSMTDGWPETIMGKRKGYKEYW